MELLSITDGDSLLLLIIIRKAMLSELLIQSSPFLKSIRLADLLVNIAIRYVLARILILFIMMKLRSLSRLVSLASRSSQTDYQLRT